MAQVLTYNTGSNPHPEVFFTGALSDCIKYVKDNGMFDDPSIEISTKATTPDCVEALVKAKERICKALDICAAKPNFNDERAFLVSALVCINNILE